MKWRTVVGNINLKNMLNEANQQWKVKDIIVMQKAHERVLKATASLQKAVERLGAVSNKNRNKPNGGMFVKEAESMRKTFLKSVMPGSRFWKTWEEYRKGGEAAFPKDWKKTRS